MSEDARSAPVWQLTDGTVIIQGADLPDSKLRAGHFVWRDAERRQPRPVRQAVMRLLEKL